MAKNKDNELMTDFKRWRISLQQAMYLALTVLAIYYPISIYVNIPAERILGASAFLLIPAALNFIFYVLLILVADRLIDKSEKVIGGKLLMEFRFSTLLLTVPFAILATYFSHLLFSSSFQLINWVQSLSGNDIPNRAESISEMRQLQLESFRRTNNGLTLMTVLSIFYLIINRKANFRMKDMEVHAEQLIKENAVAQFEALKNQVSPHFLFNSLSILSSLVHVDAELADKFIEQLSKAYRHILEQKDKDTISLRSEIDFVRSYAFLLKIRFENRFDVNINVSPAEGERYNIAPLTLQLLIENCVKHNSMTAEDPLNVSIVVAGDYLEISNQIKPRQLYEKHASTGIGLNNIINRYKLLTDRAVEVTQTQGIFKVKIPLL